MSKYKIINGHVARMSDKHCGDAQMSNHAIIMALNKQDKLLKELQQKINNKE